MDQDLFKVYRLEPTFSRVAQNGNILMPEFDASGNPRNFACFPAVNFERCSPSTAEDVVADCVFRISAGREIVVNHQMKRLICRGKFSTTMGLGLIEINFGGSIPKDAPFDLIFQFFVGTRQIFCNTYTVQTKRSAVM
ncbi:hypothetical protein BH10CYA1_BH10CYA1_62520 [soil metagenome]